jgi:hypothetical protein
VTEVVILRGGVSVLADALRLAWELEARDVQLLVDDDGALRAGPAERLTDADIQAIRANREELKRIVVYCGNPWLM